MKSDRHWPVAIVGAGFSGTMAAAQLARRGIASVLIDAAKPVGLGAAYSTHDPAHLLNVPAGNMSAWPDAPDDFCAGGRDPAGFAQRRDYGAYLRQILSEAEASGCVRVIHDRAVGATRDSSGWGISLGEGAGVWADALVLATGNQPPAKLGGVEASRERLIDNPWNAQARDAVGRAAASGAAVLIVGTGLTMVDVVLSLDAAGHMGNIVALSRRGLAPRAHVAYEAAPVSEDDVPAGNARVLVRWLRGRAGQYGWRAAIDSLRPHSHRIWQSLPWVEKRRFLRHARPWWDVHRHRIAPQVAGKLVDMIAAGRLEVIAGRMLGSRSSDGGIEVAYRRRGVDEVTRREFAYIFNCTGPLPSIAYSADPLLKQMLADGLVHADELGIGLDVDGQSRVEGAERLWALGALTKGRFWEIIAVPDIRQQAATVAEDIERELAR